MCDIFGGGSKSVPVSSKTEIPAWVEQGGQDLYGAGKEFASRDYPAYPTDQRIAPFTDDQQASFASARGNVGAWGPAFESAYAGAGASAVPVGEEDIARYMNPYTQSVIDTTLGEMDRQYNRDTNIRHGEMASRGSYLNEDRRAVIDNLARESNARVKAETAARLRAGAYSDALGQANTERGRTLQAAQTFGNLAPLRQGLGAGDTAQLASSGALQQAQDQQGRTLEFDEFMGEFQYPQEQINWLMGLLSGTPYPTSTSGTQAVATGNPWAQALGAGIAAYGAFG